MQAARRAEPDNRGDLAGAGGSAPPGRPLLGLGRLWPGFTAVAAALLSYRALAESLEVTLRPHVWALEAITGLRFRFTEGLGYVASDGTFALTAGCTGVRLFLSAFLLLALGFPPRGRPIKRLGTLCAYYLGALVGALWVTVGRVALSVPLCRLSNGQLLHNLLSLFIYFGSLTALFVAAQFLRERRARRSEGGEP